MVLRAGIFPAELTALRGLGLLLAIFLVAYAVVRRRSLRNADVLILIASGSEVSVEVDAHERLLAQGVRSRVVSMASWDIFEHQSKEYRESVLPPNVTARIAIEQASTFGWERW